MIIKNLKVGENELVNVPAEETVLKDLGVNSADITALLAEAKKAHLDAQFELARKHAYAHESDGVGFDYLAALAEFGESSPEAQAAKTVWLTARNSVKARYPKP